MSSGDSEPHTGSNWAAIRPVFDAVADLSAAQREPLIQAAGLSLEASTELRGLLAHHDAAATSGAAFLAADARATLAETPAPAVRPGQRLGAWEVVRAIGAGGMGEVFEARRADGSYEGRAAVKLLKRGMDSAAVLRRFAQERQALARLNHPHIARLLDAGASEQGLPYFVLEFVDGQPLDAAVSGLPLDARLQLFLQLADAVAHAHRNLLVHRDLKPGNVLVDREGQVKLLDFGIAKALDPLEGHDGQTTVGGQRPYTPNYASPEQIRGEPVSTATDIYSLGVLLYQMLTGTRPTGRKATTPAEAARSVLEDEPTRPSRLSAGEAVDPQWLQSRRRLEGDLDNILLKALEKAPERRYASVDAFAADVQAMLQGRPVSARPASAGYVLGRFVRRNRWSVLAGSLGGVGLATGLAAALLQDRVATALGAVGLAGGLALALFQGRRAALARDEAQARLDDIRRITGGLVFRFGDAVSYLPGGMQIKEELLQDALRSLDRLAHGRDRDPALLADVANTYARLAELQFSDQLSLEKPEAAQANAMKAVALGTPLLAQRPADWRLHSWLSRAHLVLGKVHRARGEWAAGLAALQRAAAVLGQADVSQADDLGRVTVLGSQASTLITCAQTQDLHAVQQGLSSAEALATFAEAEAVYRRLNAQRDLLERIDATGRAEEPKAVAQIMVQLGVITGTRSRIHLRNDALAEALAETAESMRWLDSAVAADPATQIWQDAVATEANHQAALHLYCGDGVAALAAAERCIDTARRLAAADGPDSKWAGLMPRLGGLRARALAALGRHDEAMPWFQPALDYHATACQKTQPGPALETALRAKAQLQTAQAATLQALGRVDEALPAVQAAAQTLQPLADSQPPLREALLLHAQALSLQATMDLAAAPVLRAWALKRLDAAQAIAPLAGLSARLAAELNAVPASDGRA
jgi:eukaryotic-like serine/threonine-protein kinase